MIIGISEFLNILKIFEKDVNSVEFLLIYLIEKYSKKSGYSNDHCID